MTYQFEVDAKTHDDGRMILEQLQYLWKAIGKERFDRLLAIAGDSLTDVAKTINGECELDEMTDKALVVVLSMTLMSLGAYHFRVSARL